MKSLKKFNTYLLENHPLTWHSKFIQLLLAGILIWVISFLSGFGLINMKALQNIRINSYYFNSLFIFFHVIYCIVVIAFWALYFYKNNAFKSYYPLQKGYFTKLFFHLFVPITLLVSAYFPFTLGCKEKMEILINENEVGNDINILNLGNAFLVNNFESYRINSRSYPKVYSYITINSFDENEQEWSNKGLINDSNTIVLDGHKMQFYHEKEIYLDSKHCKTKTIIDKYYTEKELFNPQLYSIFNFSEELILNLNEEGIYINENQAILISNWVKNKKYAEIENSINEFKKTCDKYEVDYRINTNHVSSYLKYKEFKDLKKIIRHYQYIDPDYFPEDDIQSLNLNIKNRTLTIEQMENQAAYYFNGSNLQSIFSNYFYYTDRSYDIEILLVFLFISLGLTWLFIGFEFASIKHILITIPIGGVIIVLNFIIFFTLFSHNNMDDKITNSFIFTFTLIIGTTLYALISRNIGKKYLNILITLTYIIAPIYFMFIIGSLYNNPRYYSYYDKCHRLQSHYDKSFLLEPGLFFLYSLIGILLFFPLLRKWKAYEE